MRGNTLHISSARTGWGIFNNSNLVFSITFENLQKLKMSGSAKVYSKNMLSAEAFDLTLSGSGYVELALETREMNTNISGSGKVNLDGNASHLSLLHRLSAANRKSGFRFRSN